MLYSVQYTNLWNTLFLKCASVPEREEERLG